MPWGENQGIWLWERAHSRFRRLLGEPLHRYYEYWWSPSGRYLLIRDGGDGLDTLWLYDAERRQLRKLRQTKGLCPAAWSTKDTVIIVDNPGQKKEADLLMPRTGRQRTLFRWPTGTIEAITQLGGGAGYAISSGFLMDDAGTGIYLADGRVDIRGSWRSRRCTRVREHWKEDVARFALDSRRRSARGTRQLHARDASPKLDRAALVCRTAEAIVSTRR